MNIYVGNLPLELTKDELLKEFAPFGQVKSLNIMNNRDIGSGQQWGYGFVEMVLETEGKVAINTLKGKIIGGRAIVCIESLSFSGNSDTNNLDTRRSARFNRQKQREIRNKLNRIP